MPSAHALLIASFAVAVHGVRERVLLHGERRVRRVQWLLQGLLQRHDADLPGEAREGNT